MDVQLEMTSNHNLYILLRTTIIYRKYNTIGDDII